MPERNHQPAGAGDDFDQLGGWELQVMQRAIGQPVVDWLIFGLERLDGADAMSLRSLFRIHNKQRVDRLAEGLDMEIRYLETVIAFGTPSASGTLPVDLPLIAGEFLFDAITYVMAVTEAGEVACGRSYRNLPQEVLDALLVHMQNALTTLKEQGGFRPCNSRSIH